MRVVFVHNDFNLYWRPRLTALNAVVRTQGGELKAIEVSGTGSPYDFPLDHPETSDDQLTPVTLFPGEDVRNLSAKRVSRRIYETLDELKPDVVLASPIAFTPGATAIRWCRENHRGVAIVDNTRQQDVRRPRVVDAIKRRIFANVDAMLIPAPSHSTTYEKFELSADRVFFGLNVTDNAWFETRAGAARESNCREVAGRQLPARFFLVVGRQVRKKNIQGTLRAYERYRREAGEAAWDLVLVGDGPERTALRELARELGLGGVHFLPFLSPSQLAVVYAAAQCLVLASFYGETWGIVVNEAMACGVPVLVSNECGCSQTLVEQGKNGWTFNPHDVAELAGAMVKLASLPTAQLEQMGQDSRRIISGWGIERFAQGAWMAIEACRDVRRGYAGPVDRLLLNLWKGRYRPT